MNLEKQYIIQVLSRSANNLRLSTEKIEVVALLKEYVKKSDDIEADLQYLKKITEFSKLAIKIWPIYLFISKDSIDFLKISDIFKEHSSSLLREFSHFLDVVTPQNFQTILDEHPKPNEDEVKYDNPNFVIEEESENIEKEKVEVESDSISEKVENELEKEKLIFEDLHSDDEFNFEKFEETILKPIKTIDALLERLNQNSYSESELDNIEDLMRENENLSNKAGFEIIANMHGIFAYALRLIKYKEIIPVKPVVEGMRACLIVIVAVVRNKNVDITSYLNRAELFAQEIMYTKMKGD